MAMNLNSYFCFSIFFLATVEKNETYRFCLNGIFHLEIKFKEKRKVVIYIFFL